MKKWIESLFKPQTFPGDFLHNSVKIPCNFSLSSTQLSISGKFLNKSFNLRDLSSFSEAKVEPNTSLSMISWTTAEEEFLFIFKNKADLVQIQKKTTLPIIFTEEPKIKQKITKCYENSEKILFFSVGDLLSSEDISKSTVILVVVMLSEFLFSLDIVDYGEILMRVYLTQDFHFMTFKNENKVEWIQEEQDTRIVFSFRMDQPVENLQKVLDSTLIKVSQFQIKAKPLTHEHLIWLNQSLSDQSDSETFSEDSQDEILHSSIIPEITDSSISSSGIQTFISSKNSLTVFSNSSQEVISTSLLSYPHPSRDICDILPTYLLPSSSKLLLSNKLEPSLVLTFDFAREKITSSHSLPSQNDVKGISFPSCEESCDFLALSRSSMYRIDPRSVNYVVQSYSYSTAPRFSCFSPTFDEHLTVGCESGEIKLYSKVGQKAKTRFPGFGLPIKSIEVTLDSQWILATSSEALIVMPTLAFGVNGFLASISKRPRKARKLVLAPSDLLKLQITKTEFTPAKFSRNGKEEIILTSTGRWLVLWNFKMVQKGKVEKYKIIEKKNLVVKGEFIPGSEKAVVTFNEGIEVLGKF
jgi:hypothetical protein